MTDNGVRDAIASLKAYLEELRDTGVDGLPLAADESALPAGGSTAETLDGIRGDLGECVRCSLGKGRTNLVFGVGDPHASLVFVGEAPGRDEDLQGEPFVGEAGQLLTKIIQAMGLERRQVYICNVLKCRPPNNRNPLPTEIEQCHPFLLRQLKAIGPGAIVALGTFAAQTLLQTREPISKLRGHFHDYHGIPLMPTFHPAFLLRNAAMKREVWEDMQQVMKKLGMALPEKKNG
jgi:uracil-DNA glycosylase family 4